jgi:hypothetical protein
LILLTNSFLAALPFQNQSKQHFLHRQEWYFQA